MKQTLQLNRKKKKSTWTDDLMPRYYIKRTCKHCGSIVNFYHSKKFICKNCGYFIYYDEQEEFRDRMKGLIK